MSSNPTRRSTKGHEQERQERSGEHQRHGRAAARERKIRVAIVGVGNCASSLVQGRYYYQDASPDDFVPGLMHVELGGYHVRDIEFVAAFDIDKNKVGKDLSEAIYAKPNNTYVFQQVPKLDVKVERGMTHDGLGKYLRQIIEKAPGPTADVVGILKERKVDLVVSYLPVGSEEATKWYVEQALKAGVGFINAIPVFIGREPYWQRRFAAEGLPVIGDDIKSQVGATITHRVLTRLFMDRGVRLDRTYQLNFGGNTDFLNMLERERLESKKISKTNAVTSMLDYELDPDDIHVGPSDHVPWLKDRKWCYIRMEGTTFGDVPLNAELKLEVWDSPNSAGVITDAIRCLKLGLDRGLQGTLVAPSSYFMKSPPQQIHDDIAFNRVEAFIRGEDNETLVGTETAKPKKTRKLAAPAAHGRERRDCLRDRRVPAGPHRAPGTDPGARGGPQRGRVLPPPTRPGRARRAGRATHPGAAGRARLPGRLVRHRPYHHAHHRASRPGAVPGRLSRVGRPSDASSRRNMAHVLGLPADAKQVRRLARRTYGSYARFALELMRLPSRPVDEPLRLLPPVGACPRGVRGAVGPVPGGGPGHHRRVRPHRQHRDLRRLLFAPGRAHLGRRG